VAAWTLASLLVVGGIGWLYLLRDAAALRQGPKLRDALPLEQLASHSSQPLLVVALAFVPSGIAAGLVLAWLGWVPARTRILGLALLAAVVLIVDAAVSGAVAQNESVVDHILPTLGHSGVWVEAALVVIGATLTASAGFRARPGAAAAASAA